MKLRIKEQPNGYTIEEEKTIANVPQMCGPITYEFGWVAICTFKTFEEAKLFADRTISGTKIVYEIQSDETK